MACVFGGLYKCVNFANGQCLCQPSLPSFQSSDGSSSTFAQTMAICSTLNNMLSSIMENIRTFSTCRWFTRKVWYCIEFLATSSYLVIELFLLFFLNDYLMFELETKYHLEHVIKQAQFMGFAQVRQQGSTFIIEKFTIKQFNYVIFTI